MRIPKYPGELPAGLTEEDMDIGLAVALLAAGQNELAEKIIRSWDPVQFARASVAAVKFSTMGRDIGIQMRERLQAALAEQRGQQT